MTLTSPLPKDLRPQLHERLDALPEEELVFLHELMLHAEKDRLWREIQADATAESDSGKWDRLPQIIQEVRSRLRAS